LLLEIRLIHVERTQLVGEWLFRTQLVDHEWLFQVAPDSALAVAVVELDAVPLVASRPHALPTVHLVPEIRLRFAPLGAANWSRSPVDGSLPPGLADFHAQFATMSSVESAPHVAVADVVGGEVHRRLYYMPYFEVESWPANLAAMLMLLPTL
jgi:hypothetical protein